MNIYDYAQHLALDTGWNVETIARLLAEFLDEQDEQLLKKCRCALDEQYEEEMGIEEGEED